MKITEVISHVLSYDLPDELGYSQQYYARRTAHLVEVRTDEGADGLGASASVPAMSLSPTRRSWKR